MVIIIMKIITEVIKILTLVVICGFELLLHFYRELTTFFYVRAE